ncbi:MAG TPA: 3-deoxy-manno-octulosonate cytidylyltransferase [Candidatus Cloacimonetes bacterium]|nr:3-deoxy-manno-octulosonate cytidylyltransferase [Candidatus Cloacimonadota bacterium]HEX37360.1 3-deoxy-manno-octulosonate cytidylyltransferase [Candidatus Cloacimonadota bacterium]
MTKRSVAIIPSRYGSTRLPGKPLRKIAGKTLINHIYNNIRNSKLFEDVIVVTDDERISDEVKSFSGIVKISQKQYNSGSDRIAEIAQDINAELFVNVQGDELFISKYALQSLLSCFEDKNIQVATLAHELTNNEDIENPNRVKVICDQDGDALYFSRSVIPYKRGDENYTYLGHIGVYAFRKEALIRFSKLKQSTLEKVEKLEQLRLLENNVKIRVNVIDYKGFGIDTEEDLSKAEKLLKNIS